MTKRRYIPVMLVTVLVSGNSWTMTRLGSNATNLAKRLFNSTSSFTPAIPSNRSSSFVPNVPSSKSRASSQSFSTSNPLLHEANVDITGEGFTSSSNPFVTLNKAKEELQNVEKGYKSYWDRFKGFTSKNWLLKYLFGLGVGGAGLWSQVETAYGEPESEIQKTIEWLRSNPKQVNVNDIKNVIIDAEKYFSGQLHELHIYAYDPSSIEANDRLIMLKRQILELEAFATAYEYERQMFLKEGKEKQKYEFFKDFAHNIVIFVSAVDRDNSMALWHGFSSKVVPNVLIPEINKEQMRYVASNKVLMEKNDVDFANMVEIEKLNALKKLENFKKISDIKYDQSAELYQRWDNARGDYAQAQRSKDLINQVMQAWQEAKQNPASAEELKIFEAKYGPLPIIKSSKEQELVQQPQSKITDID